MDSASDDVPRTPKLNNEGFFFESFPDLLCKLNLEETSEFVKALPSSAKSRKETPSFSASAGPAPGRSPGGAAMAAQQKRIEAPSTPGRPVFSFSSAKLPRKNSIPSKWNDAEKWLISSSCNESPAHATKTHVRSSKVSQKFDDLEVFLKDKFTDVTEPSFSEVQLSKPTKERLVSRSSLTVAAVNLGGGGRRRDVWSDMTQKSSSPAILNNTPTKDSSPARHNTPENRSGLLVPCKKINISEFEGCHLAKLELSAQYESMHLPRWWASREEEEEEVSKSLRHYEFTGGDTAGKSIGLSVKEEDKMKSCIRYQIEEAKIQAWVNLQSAKAETKARKLEVKIQNMRSNLEEKLMRRMAVVHRKAEEWRTEARIHHSQQLAKAPAPETMKMCWISSSSCGCIPSYGSH